MREKSIQICWVSICAFIGGFAALTPATQAETDNSDSSGWSYELTPYIWATSQDGTVGLDKGPGNGVPLDQSFSDILQRMDIAGMAAFDVRYRRWGLLLDAIYLKVSDSGHVSGPNGFVTLSGDGDITQTLFSAAGYYRAIEGETSLDTMLGLRYHAVDWDVNAQLSAPNNSQISRRLSERKSWTDPYAGLRILHKLDDRWSLMGYGDIGGSNSGSDLTWQVMGGVNYAFRPDMIGKLGYRHLYYDYQNNGFKYKVETSGLYVGLGFVW